MALVGQLLAPASEMKYVRGRKFSLEWIAGDQIAKASP
jgi:hypothetical protein